METQTPTDNEWHQQPWIWFIIGLLVVTMMASFAMLFIAMKNAPELVIENYSNIEELTEQTRTQDKRATELGLSAMVYVENRQLAIDMNSNDNSGLPTSIIVRTANSTMASLDSRAEMTGNNGRYVGELALPANGYDLHIEDPAGSWRLSKRVFGVPETIELKAFSPVR